MADNIVALGVSSLGNDLFGDVTAAFSLIEDTRARRRDGSAQRDRASIPPWALWRTTAALRRRMPCCWAAPRSTWALNSKNLATDQRGSGFDRHSGVGVDIGAYELQLPSGAELFADPRNPSQLVLVVTGTTGDDNAVIVPKSTTVVRVNFNGVKTDFANVSRIMAFGRRGNDKLTVSDSLNKNAFLDGGDGNDTLEGGAGADILLGQAGNDTLRGFSGLDVLIGGDGIDDLSGGVNDDLLVGGRTDYDNYFKGLGDDPEQVERPRHGLQQPSGGPADGRARN